MNFNSETTDQHTGRRQTGTACPPADAGPVRSDRAQNFVSCVVSTGVKLVVWDFDRTACAVHTGGAVSAINFGALDTTISGLGLNLSRDFLLVSRKLDALGIHQAIASFASDRHTRVDASHVVLGGAGMIRAIFTKATHLRNAGVLLKQEQTNAKRETDTKSLTGGKNGSNSSSGNNNNRAAITCSSTFATLTTSVAPVVTSAISIFGHRPTPTAATSTAIASPSCSPSSPSMMPSCPVLFTPREEDGKMHRSGIVEQLKEDDEDEDEETASVTHLHRMFVVAMYPVMENTCRDPNLGSLPLDKSYHLREAMRYFGVTEPSRVLLIDDDARNVESAAASGSFGVCVLGDHGFALNALRLRKASSKASNEAK